MWFSFHVPVNVELIKESMCCLSQSICGKLENRCGTFSRDVFHRYWLQNKRRHSACTTLNCVSPPCRCKIDHFHIWKPQSLCFSEHLCEWWAWPVQNGTGRKTWFIIILLSSQYLDFSHVSIIQYFNMWIWQYLKRIFGYI